MSSWLRNGSARAASLAGPLIAGAGGAGASEYGRPADYAIGFQLPATDVARDMQWFHNGLLAPIIVTICLFVLGLLIYVALNFNEKSNPTPSPVTHNSTLEVAWTVLPIVILLIIAIPSFKLLYKEYDFPRPDVVVKATGHQWYWEYKYPEADGVEFESYMLEDDDLAEGQPRLLSVDNEIVVPVNKVVHVLVTADDVIHNWTVPSFGTKTDAVPGRTTATWFRAEREGIYYGQCSELCGTRHAFMPIAVRVVNDGQYGRWIEARKSGDDDAVEAVMKEIVAHQKKNSTVAALQN